jgi:sec-independent protein translocase protein TatA
MGEILIGEDTMPNLGAPELIIILIIILLVFGVGRIGKIGGELGSGIRAFRDGLKGPEDEKKDETKEEVIEEKKSEE